MKVALLGTLACEQRERLAGLVTMPFELVPLPDGAPMAEVAATLGTTPAMVTLKYQRGMPPAPALGLLHVGGAGYDDIDLDYLPPGAVVCNAFGHDVPIAEYVILAMLQWCSRFIEAERSLRVEGHWRLGGRTGAPLQQELAGKTVGILGLGQIGRALIPRALAMGTEVIVSTRTPGPLEPGVAWIGGPDRLDELLARADFVVVTCALTPDTLGLLDRRRLATMKRTGVVINVSRGPIIEEAALYEALLSGSIGGAVIDAWYQYPTRDDLTVPPSRFRFQDLPNVLMTPHSSAWTTGMIERRWATIAANLDRFARGEPLVNVVYRA
ncbi:MAG: phosphoglycerate dehydrogenase [Gemmatimonadetes bacterium]|nr:phosphoglycerate dehydrogenase [Gemmatimonadota bacterium]